MKPEAKSPPAAMLAVRQVLDRKADGLGAGRLSALSAARNHALGRYQAPKATAVWLGAMVSAAALALAVVMLPREAEVLEPSNSLMGTAVLSDADLELVFDAPELELVENLEFYLWLESEADS